MDSFEDHNEAAKEGDKMDGSKTFKLSKKISHKWSRYIFVGSFEYLAEDRDGFKKGDTIGYGTLV